MVFFGEAEKREKISDDISLDLFSCVKNRLFVSTWIVWISIDTCEIYLTSD